MKNSYKKSNTKSKDGKKAVKSVKGKRKTSYQQGTSLEYELERFLEYLHEEDDPVIFRTPASQTPADVWMVRRTKIYPDASVINLYQCKTTRDLVPPRLDSEEFLKFKDYCKQIGATGFWVDRWKKNKNVYIRRLRMLSFEKDSLYHPFELETGFDDWTDELKKAQAQSYLKSK